ncbi:hypothetical protein Sjap_004246 [Stephania japonica]|uniref:Receptor-like serine/threonine-protein kinase n=1 Tax=Stephania japonica TaxID=461633 RepID=A0AAP0K1Y1_9MAGN
MILHLLLCLLLPLLPNSSAQTFRNITLGSALSTLDENPYWVSPSGEFAFGFYSIKGELFLLSIWFAKIPLKTIVWTANRDRPVEGGSKVELTSDGVLSLTNHTGGEIWRAESSNATNAASAAVLDTGNLVLRSSDLAILWASFDEPTDTILPGQTLDRGSKLFSSISDEDHSSGKFQLSVQADGNLVLQSIARPTEGTYDPYWESNTEDTQSRLVFNESGLMYLITPLNGTRFDIATEIPVSTRDFYQRATIDFDGVFRKYNYPKSSTNRNDQSWSVTWYVPGDICTVLTGNVGSGACGFNSYCVLGQDERPNCECPPGYDYVDGNNRFKGCKQTFAPQSCEKDQLRKAFEMRELVNTDWPLSDYEHFLNVDAEWCSNTCLDDCFCAVSIIRGSECWLKKIPLSNGRRDPSINGKALIKVGNSSFPTNNTSFPPNVLPTPDLHCNEKRERQHKLILPGSIIIGTSLFLNLLLLVIFLSTKHKNHKSNRVTSSSVEGNLQCFTYKELEEATNGFKEELGKGAYSVVYKGVLRRNAQGLIAVKRLTNIPEEVDKELKNEMRAIGQSNHKNLVKLLGFCDEGTHRLLVYELMIHGSLAKFLFEMPRPSWYKRIQIAIGIARGLTYLHEECCTQIIHCDVKPHNILLDESFTARISDFGLAKLLKTDQTRTTTAVRGTRGYVAPEWFKGKAITSKVDVYSFGIVLMEIIFCRRNAAIEVGREDPEILSEDVYDAYVQGKLQLLLGDDEEAKNDRRLERMVMVAIWCVQDDSSLRPSMRKVLQMLEGAADVPTPPDPFYLNSTV